MRRCGVPEADGLGWEGISWDSYSAVWAALSSAVERR